jgi:hypothetical protein
MKTIAETVEPTTKSKRSGRPPTGKAMSGSDRQARRREKLEAEGKAILPQAVVSLEVRQALKKFIKFKPLTLGDAIDLIVRDRLLRKRSGRRRKPASKQQHDVSTEHSQHGE